MSNKFRSIYDKFRCVHTQHLLYKFVSVAYRFFAIFLPPWRLYWLRKFHLIEILSCPTFANQTIMNHISLTDLKTHTHMQVYLTFLMRFCTRLYKSVVLVFILESMQCVENVCNGYRLQENSYYLNTVSFSVFLFFYVFRGLKLRL